MLRVKSFKIDDDKGINALLDTNRLAAGAHILVSEGQVLIPYEDGREDTPAQKAVAIQEQANKMAAERSIIEHSQKVLEFLQNDARSRIFALEADRENAEGKEIYELKRKIETTKNALSQLESQHITNEQELARLSINIEKFAEQVEALSKPNPRI